MKTLRNLRRDEKGFTLIEIMIVILIIGLLLAIAIPNFLKARNASRLKTCLTNMRQIDSAKEEWAMSNSGTPVFADLIGPSKYIKGDPTDPPTCPTDGSGYTINAIGTNPTCPNAAAFGHAL